MLNIKLMYLITPSKYIHHAFNLCKINVLNYTLSI